MLAVRDIFQIDYYFQPIIESTLSEFAAEARQKKNPCSPSFGDTQRFGTSFAITIILWSAPPVGSATLENQ